MCDPISLAATSLAVGAIGTGYSMYAAGQQADYQSQVAKNNATIAQNNAAAQANAITQQETAAVQAQQRKTGALLASQRTALSANGIDANSGSALDVQSSAAEMGALDALTIRYNAASQISATGYKAAAASSNYMAQAGLDQMTGTNSQISTALGGAASIGGKWAQYQQQGIFGSVSSPTGLATIGSSYNANGFNMQTNP